MFFGQDRRQLREVFFRAWARHCQNLPLDGIETLIVSVAQRHPEYHALLEDPARYDDRDYPPEAGQTATGASLHRGPRLGNCSRRCSTSRVHAVVAPIGETNPFLHMAMHIAIEEQLALDQPRGVRDRYRQLLARFPNEHAVQHPMMECLGEWLWRASRDGAPPPESAYLDCLGRLADPRAAG